MGFMEFLWDLHRIPMVFQFFFPMAPTASTSPCGTLKSQHSSWPRLRNSGPWSSHCRDEGFGMWRIEEARIEVKHQGMGPETLGSLGRFLSFFTMKKWRCSRFRMGIAAKHGISLWIRMTFPDGEAMSEPERAAVPRSASWNLQMCRSNPFIYVGWLNLIFRVKFRCPKFLSVTILPGFPGQITFFFVAKLGFLRTKSNSIDFTIQTFSEKEDFPAMFKISRGRIMGFDWQ